MSKVLSKGIELGYKTGVATDYTYVKNLVSIPNMGAAPDKVDVTTLGNEQRHYINGLVDFGDLEFGFVYDDGTGTDAENVNTFTELRTLQTAGNPVDWELKFPGTNGLKFHFSGKPSVYLSGAEVGARVDFSMSIALESDVTVA